MFLEQTFMKGTSIKPYNKYNCNDNSGFDSSEETQLKGSLSELDNKALPSIPENNFTLIYSMGLQDRHRC